MKAVFAILVVLVSAHIHAAALINSTSSPLVTVPIVGGCNVLDTCAVFGGFRTGNFRLSTDASAFVTCTGTSTVHCTKCNPPSLFFSNRCNACMYEEDDTQNVCHTTQAYDVPTTPAFDEEFCTKNGREDTTSNFADLTNSNYYYACVHGSTWHMPCADGLSYNATCDACLV